MSGGLINKTKNPVLNAAEKTIESRLTPDTRESYFKIVNAGMAAALAKGPNGILASLRRSKDPVADAAKGAVALVHLLRKEAKGAMPLTAMIPAAMTLMIKALAFADRTGIAQVGNDELVRATHIFTNTMFASFGVTASMIQHAAVKVHGVTQDPAAMEQINRKIGAVRHPDASVPTLSGMPPPVPDNG